MPASPALIEFPADDAARARSFWSGLLGRSLDPRTAAQGEGWQSDGGDAPSVGVHARGRGPGDSLSLPYFAVEDMLDTLERIPALGGSVVHPGERWSVCKDSEGNPFGLALVDSASAARADRAEPGNDERAPAPHTPRSKGDA